MNTSPNDTNDESVAESLPGPMPVQPQGSSDSSMNVPHTESSSMNGQHNNDVDADDRQPAIKHQIPATQSVASEESNREYNIVASPKIADDADLIEKEWVNRAKAIVARTIDNPQEQSKQMNRFKADYIKKRYNKDIKVSDK
jgi:hypothetical protein